MLSKKRGTSSSHKKGSHKKGSHKKGSHKKGSHKKRVNRKTLARTYRAVPDLKQLSATSVVDSGITARQLEQLEPRGYPAHIVDHINKVIVTRTLPLITNLNSFWFPEVEPVRLTMQDVNPGGYLSMLPVIELEEDARTFPARWEAWNQRRLNARRAISQTILANPHINVREYPEIVALLS